MSKARKKPKSQLPAVIKQKSEPLKNFEENLDQIMAFVKRMSASDLAKAIEKARRSNEKVIAKSPNLDVKRIAKNLNVLSSKVTDWLSFYRPASRWIIVMLISFLEAFLEDVLAEIASRNPKVIKSEGMPVQTIIAAKSLEELKSEIRSNWAHDALRPNGPNRWYRTLRDMGAKKIDQQVITEVQHLWDTRNLIVHARGIADKSYSKKYASRGAKFGVEYNVNMASLKGWLPHVGALVEWADEFLMKYPNVAAREEGS
jgi:hypothetical protein